jgi:hypothetical protein
MDYRSQTKFAIKALLLLTINSVAIFSIRVHNLRVKITIFFALYQIINFVPEYVYGLHELQKRIPCKGNECDPCTLSRIHPFKLTASTARVHA